MGAEVLLAEGDVLFLPAYWWHEVITADAGADGLTVSVNFWCAPSPNPRTARQLVSTVLA